MRDSTCIIWLLLITQDVMYERLDVGLDDMRNFNAWPDVAKLALL